MNQRPYYKTKAQIREFDRDFPVCKLEFAVPDSVGDYLHFHNGVELGWCRKGHGLFMIAGKVRPFRTGDISFINHAEPHLARSSPGITSDWHWVQLDAVKFLSPLTTDITVADPSRLCGPLFPNVFSPDTDGALCGSAYRLFEELWGSGRYLELRCRTHFLDIMTQLQARDDIKSSSAPSRISQGAERIAPALDHVANHFEERIEVGELARLCSLSPSQFRRVFQRELGKSPLCYIVEMRVGMAGVMLKGSTKQISRIAAECGFATLSSFNRSFRAVTGTTPRGWRSSMLVAE